MLWLWVAILTAGTVTASTGISDTTSSKSVKLAQTDASVDIMDSLLQALYSSNPAWAFNENDYTSQGYAVTDTPRFSPSTYNDRINRISSTIPYVYNDYVQAYIDLYTIKRRGQMQNMLGLSQVYFPLFEEELDRNGLPIELKYLPVIESALNTHAVSRAGATGLWQLMHGTAKLLGLKIDTYVDERRDPYMATKAAVSYLKELYGIYDDWLLAIAAYNCGPGNVNKALRKAGGSNKTFWDIMPYLPRETRGYVPAFIGATYAFEYHKEHNIRPLVYGYEYTMLDTVMITQKVTLAQLAPFVGVTPEEIALYNPGLKLSVVPGFPTPFPLRLPMNSIAMFYANEDSLYSSVMKPDVQLASFTTTTKTTTAEKSTASDIDPNTPVTVNYTVKKGDNLGYISDWFDCTIPDIKKWNGMKTTKIVPGQKLKIMEPSGKSEQYASINKMTMAQKQKLTDVQIVGTSVKSTDEKKDNEVIYYTVRPGDTLWSIAQKYPENTVEEIRQMNNMSKNETLKSGAKLKLVK